MQPALGNMTSDRPKKIFLMDYNLKFKKTLQRTPYLNWKAGFCNFKTIILFSAAPSLITLISLGIWGKVIVTELILYKTIIVSYRLHFLLSEYFTIKEIHPNNTFHFLVQSLAWQTIYFCCTSSYFLFFSYFQYDFSLYNHYLNNVQLYLFIFFAFLSFLRSFEASYNNMYSV